MIDELADLKLQVSTLASQFTNALGLIEALKAEISQYKTSISRHLVLVESHSEEARRIYDENKKLSELIVRVQDGFARDLITSHKSFMDYLESIRKSVDDSLISQQDIKSLVDSIISKIETVALDAKSAVNKASRNDIVLDLHHKKFDNLLSKIKTLESMRQ